MRTTDRTDDRTAIHTVARIGRTQEITKEGFLLCRDVPIARTGVMFYAPGEIAEEVKDDAGNTVEIKPLEAGLDGIIRVIRSPEEVFSQTAMTSFIGKAVTIDHPDEDVGPGNWDELAHGFILAVRRGEAPFEDDCLLADILMTTKEGIELAKTLPEVSCGYDAGYAPLGGGKARQFAIIGNHLALVKNGRCGPRCAIGDSAMTTKPSPWDRLRAAFSAKDEAGFTSALGELETASPAGAHININVAATRDEAAPAKKTDDEAQPGGTQDEAPAWFTAYTKTADARMDALEAAMKGKTADAATDDTATGDAGAGEDQDDKKDGEGDKGKATKDAATVDSADLADSFTDMLARAEILSPGIKLPTFDAAVNRKLTTDRMCAFRRRALVAAQGGDNAETVETLIGKDTDISTMTCDGVATAFVAASEMIKRSNDSASIGFVHNEVRGDPKPASIADINAKNAAFWASK